MQAQNVSLVLEVTEIAATSTWIPSASAPRTLAEQAFTALHEGIVSGELKPGQRLRIEEFATALNMSHLPIREAIRQLEAERVGRARPASRCARDKDLDRRPDSGLRRQAPVRARDHPPRSRDFTDADAVLARDALLRHVEAGEQGRRVESWQAHTDFHFAMWTAPCQSAWLIRLVTPLGDQPAVPTDDVDAERRAAKERVGFRARATARSLHCS